MTDRQREELINRITLWHTIAYRCESWAEHGKYKHEPSRFRSDLFDIYRRMNDADLVSLIELLTVEKKRK